MNVRKEKKSFASRKKREKISRKFCQQHNRTIENIQKMKKIDLIRFDKDWMEWKKKFKIIFSFILSIHPIFDEMKFIVELENQNQNQKKKILPNFNVNKFIIIFVSRIIQNKSNGKKTSFPRISRIMNIKNFVVVV